MKIYLASDHAGFDLKTALSEHLVHQGHEVEDVGPPSLDPDDDYPKYAYQLTTKILGGDEADRGILICGSGQGMTIAANRVHGIRAALAWDEPSAKVARHDDDSNVLGLPARLIDAETAFKVTDTFLKTPFSGEERHRRRIEGIDKLYG